MGVEGIESCDRIYPLKPNPWGVWDTSSKDVWCDGGPNDQMGDFDVLPGIMRPQFGIDVPLPLADRVAVYLSSVSQVAPGATVPLVRIELRMGAGNAASSKAWAGCIMDANANGGYGAKDHLFTASGQLVTRITIWTSSVERPVRINLRLLIDKSYTAVRVQDTVGDPVGWAVKLP
jgi:hypothetical protein